MSKKLCVKTIAVVSVVAHLLQIQNSSPVSISSVKFGLPTAQAWADGGDHSPGNGAEADPSGGQGGGGDNTSTPPDYGPPNPYGDKTPDQYSTEANQRDQQNSQAGSEYGPTNPYNNMTPDQYERRAIAEQLGYDPFWGGPQTPVDTRSPVARESFMVTSTNGTVVKNSYDMPVFSGLGLFGQHSLDSRGRAVSALMDLVTNPNSIAVYDNYSGTFSVQGVPPELDAEARVTPSVVFNQNVPRMIAALNMSFLGAAKVARVRVDDMGRPIFDMVQLDVGIRTYGYPDEYQIATALAEADSMALLNEEVVTDEEVELQDMGSTTGKVAISRYQVITNWPGLPPGKALVIATNVAALNQLREIAMEIGARSIANRSLVERSLSTLPPGQVMGSFMIGTRLLQDATQSPAFANPVQHSFGTMSLVATARGIVGLTASHVLNSSLAQALAANFNTDTSTQGVVVGGQKFNDVTVLGTNINMFNNLESFIGGSFSISKTQTGTYATTKTQQLVDFSSVTLNQPTLNALMSSLGVNQNQLLSVAPYTDPAPVVGDVLSAVGGPAYGVVQPGFMSYLSQMTMNPLPSQYERVGISLQVVPSIDGVTPAGRITALSGPLTEGSFPAMQGMSGSAVVNSAGKVIGVVSSISYVAFSDDTVAGNKIADAMETKNVQVAVHITPVAEFPNGVLPR